MLKNVTSFACGAFAGAAAARFADQPAKVPPSHGDERSEDAESATPPVEGAKLKMVQVLMRHGARTPLSPMYWDGVQWDDCGQAYARPPMTVTSISDGAVLRSARDEPPDAALQRYPGGCTRGELTLLGQLQALELGQWLRQRYVGQGSRLLPDQFQPGVVLGHTTNFRRTRDTLHGVLTGLFPDSRGFEAVSTSALDNILTANVRSCGQLRSLYKSAKALVHSRALADARVVESDRRIRSKLGLSLEDDRDRIHWSKLHDALTARLAHKKSLPEGLTAADLEEINRQATADVLAVVADSSHDGIVRLSMGRLLKTVEGLFEDAVAGAPAAKLVLWSGHDTTLMPVLIALGQDVTEWPPYVSTIVLELWAAPGADGAAQPEARHFVRMFFNRREIVLPEQPPGAPLSLATFREHVLAPYALSAEEHEAHCHFTHDSSLPGIAVDSNVDTSQY